MTIKVSTRRLDATILTRRGPGFEVPKRHLNLEVAIRDLKETLRSALLLSVFTEQWKYDAQFRTVFDAIRNLMAPTLKPCQRIGFRPRA
ncbi:MAG: hypothetical protein ACRD1B_12255 [Thermoanaerobaculia bacterium]